MPANDLLNELASRHEITQILYRFARAADRCDEALFRSLYHPDASVDHGGMFAGTAARFIEIVVPMLKGIGPTTHFILNTLIDLQGDKASCEAYALHCHRLEKDGAPFDSVFALRHLHRFEKRGGEWKIAHHQVVFDWNRDSPAADTWAKGLFGPTFHRGAKDHTDPLYQRG